MLKKFLAVLAVTLVLGGTVFAFAYWDNLQKQEQEELNIGNGVTLQVAAVATAEEGKVLVPAGVVMKADDVDSIVLTYNVNLDEEALEDLDLEVLASNILIGGSNVNAGLVNVDISLASPTVNASNVLVTVTVTLDEPLTLEVYDAIRSQPITFDLTFTGSIA